MTFAAFSIAVHDRVSGAGAGVRRCSGRNMFAKALIALGFAFALVAAAPAPVVLPAEPNIAPPPAVAANPANHWFLELSNGGKIEILLRPDLAPNHVAQFQALIRR